MIMKVTVINRQCEQLPVSILRFVMG